MDDMAALLSFANCYSAPPPADLFDFSELTGNDDARWDAAIAEGKFEREPDSHHRYPAVGPSGGTFADYFIDTCNNNNRGGDSCGTLPLTDSQPTGGVVVGKPSATTTTTTTPVVVSNTTTTTTTTTTTNQQHSSNSCSDRASDTTSEPDNSNSSRSSPSRTQGGEPSESGSANGGGVSYADILKAKKATAVPEKKSPVVRCSFSVNRDKKPTAAAATTTSAISKSKKTTSYKSVLCSKYSESGRCPYGINCLYAHGTHELKSAASTKPRESLTEKEQGRLFKTKLCRVFTDRGSCPYGKTCVYAHGKQELRDSSLGSVTILKRKVAK